jgi:hypothetical protein
MKPRLQGLPANSALTLLAIQRSLSIVLLLSIPLVKRLALLTPNLFIINNISLTVILVSTPVSSLVRTLALAVIETASLTLAKQTAIKLAKQLRSF